jgi:predicted Zn-dependent protease
VNGYVDTRRAVMTGLSRDGCFLVEDGRVVRAVGNVRMTDSFLEMLARVDGATRERVAVAGAWTENGALVVPQAVRIPGVMMTSGSQ